MAKLCGFGKRVKKILVDIDKNQEWLIAQVREDTGLYLDSAYMSKILTGQRTSYKVIASIKKILCIQDEA